MVSSHRFDLKMGSRAGSEVSKVNAFTSMKTLVRARGKDRSGPGTHWPLG